MSRRWRIDSLAGALLSAVMLSMIVYEYTGIPGFAHGAGALAVAAILGFSIGLGLRRATFLAVATMLVSFTIATRSDWHIGLLTAAERGAFVVALFAALSAIRSAAATSRTMLECGRFLAGQPPGRRYLALTTGGHLFGLILMYGSISLLGGLAVESTSREPNPTIRQWRLRRMLVAINRGFASTLCWSPIGFSMAITVSLIPGASWSGVALYGLVSTVLMVLVGWAMDRLTGPRPGTLATGFPQSSAREWVAQLYPLFALLLLVVIAASVLHFWTGIEVAGAVMSLVPVIAAIWVMVQDRPAGEGAVTRVTRWAMRFTTEELPGYRGQIVLLFMAAFIGSLGAFALVPIVRHLGIDLTQVPPLVLLVGLVWLVLLTGQIGMNPILSVSLIVPLLPAPELLGLPPAALVVAITGGWALSGTTSPFTASVLLVAAFAKVPARYAGLRWSGVFSLVMGTIISAWAVLIALRWV